VVGQLGDQQPVRRLAGHGQSVQRRGPKAEPPVVGKIADQQHHGVACPSRHVEAREHQRGADALALAPWVDGQRPEKQRFGILLAQRHRPVLD